MSERQIRRNNESPDKNMSSRDEEGTDESGILGKE